MTTEKKGCLAFAVCGSFCTLEDALGAAQALTAQGWTLLPVMSFAAQQNTRFGTGESWRQRLQAVTGQPVLDTLQAVEPLGPRRLAQALVVAPCTGATLARLAAGLSDTPVTLAAKSLLRVGSPVVLAVSTNDGLGASGENMARLCQRKHYYFVPYGQDDPFAAGTKECVNLFSAGKKCGILQMMSCRHKTDKRRIPDEKIYRSTVHCAAFDRRCAGARRGSGGSGSDHDGGLLHH